MVMLRILLLLRFLNMGQCQTIKVGHVEYTTATLSQGIMEAKAAFRFAEKRLRDEKIIPKSIKFKFAWEPADSAQKSTGAAANLYYKRNYSDWIIGPAISTCKFLFYHYGS